MDFNSEMFEDMTDEDSGDSSSEESDSNETVSKRKQPQNNQDKAKKVKYDSIRDPDNQKKAKNDLYKPPTVQELNELKETENLFNNNLFRLQIKELVGEIEIKNKRKKFISKWLNDFKQKVETITEYEEVLLSKVKPQQKAKSKLNKLLNNLATKYPKCLKTDQDVTLKFVKPEEIATFGLYENQALPGPNLEVKVQLKMPKECFYNKDYMNNRYLVKRYYYLLYIAEELLDEASIVYEENNYLLPILFIQPKEMDKVNVKIYATAVDDCFKPNRCLADMNNMKLNLFEPVLDIDNLQNEPSLMYNCTLGHDLTLSQNNEFIKSTLNEQLNIQEGIKLLLIWAKQREINVGFGALTDDIIVYLVVYLAQKRKINKHMSSYQVVRNFWNFMIGMDLHKNPLTLNDGVSTQVLDCFKEEYDLVLLDTTGCFNVLGFLSLEMYKRIKMESELSLRHLDDNRVNSFQSLFLSKLPFYLQYDMVLNIKELPSIKLLDDKEKAKNIGYHPMLAIKHMIDILKQALNKRVVHFVPQLTDFTQQGRPQNIKIGINLDPDHAFNFIELGPLLNDPLEAEQFRKFWGNLASDRRFRDGSARVAVYFKTRTIQEKRQIVKKIIDFVLKEKLKLTFEMFYDEFERLITNKKLATNYPLGTNEEATLKVVHLSDELGKIIRDLKMSLAVTGVQGCSEVYSYTDVFPPLATNYKVGEKLNGQNMVLEHNEKLKMVPRLLETVDCVLQLEHSSKWPNNLAGIRHLKTSFYLEMSKLLQKHHELLTHVTRDYLEVFYQGMVFRYRIYLPKEISLLKKESTDNGLITYKESLDSFSLNKKLNIEPKLVAALKGLQSQFPSFGAGTALIKRWLRAQLIDDYHLPAMVVNLLNASLYLGADKQTNTPQMSFLRFLKFMVDAQWDLQPVLVNFNEEISKDDLVDLESKFQQNRASLQALYIITPQDNGESIFTKTSPNLAVLTRIKDLAQATLQVYSEGFTGDVRDFFTPNWDGYNLIINLSPLANPRKHEQVHTDQSKRIMMEKYNEKKKSIIPVVNFNPIDLYLKELRQNYSDYALFFHDTYGGHTIGVLWTAKVSETKDFKVFNVHGRKLIGDKLAVDVDTLIEDFYIMGKDLVKTIEKK